MIFQYFFFFFSKICLEIWRSQVRASSYDSNKSTNRMQLFFTSLLLDVHIWLNMFRASPRPSSEAYNCTTSLYFYLWKETAGSLLVVVWPDHDQQRSSRFFPKVEPEAPNAKTNIHLSLYLAQFFLEWEMLQTKVVEKIKTRILCSITFFFPPENRAVYEIVWEKYSRAREAAEDYCTAHAPYMLDN